MKRNHYKSIIRDPEVLALATEAHLSHQQKNKVKAAKIANTQIDKITRAFESSLSRILNDNEILVDVNLCTGTGIEEWYTDKTKLRVKCDMEGSVASSGYIAVDYVSVFQLATISFGGKNSNSDGDEHTSLSASEKRVGLRFAMAQLSAVQKLLCPSSSCMPVEEVNTIDDQNNFEHLVFKVRASLGSTAINWYTWLPVNLFVEEPEQQASSKATLLMGENDWKKLPVKCDIELAKRKSSVSELKRFLSGKLIPIELKETVSLSLGKQVFFEGKVLENDDSLHFKIEKNRMNNK